MAPSKLVLLVFLVAAAALLGGCAAMLSPGAVALAGTGGAQSAAGTRGQAAKALRDQPESGSQVRDAGISIFLDAKAPGVTGSLSLLLNFAPDSARQTQAISGRVNSIDLAYTSPHMAEPFRHTILRPSAQGGAVAVGLTHLPVGPGVVEAAMKDANGLTLGFASQSCTIEPDATTSVALVVEIALPTGSLEVSLDSKEVYRGSPQVQSSSIPAHAPVIELTRIPAFGSFDQVEGRVLNLEHPERFYLVTYIRVQGYYWVKPYGDNFHTPLVRQDGDSAPSFSVDYTTGGIDELATSIVVYVFPNSYKAPALLGTTALPGELDQVAVAKATTLRSPTI